MPATIDLSAETVSELISEAVSNVFDTMLQMEISLERRLDETEMAGQNCPFYLLGAHDPLIFATIGFVGEANGVVYYYLERETAKSIAAQMTGLDVSDIEEEPEIMKDVVGELSNMTVGGFKNRLCEMGHSCRLTLPTVLRGSDLEVKKAGDADRYAFLFRGPGFPLVIDIFLQPSLADE